MTFKGIKRTALSAFSAVLVLALLSFSVYAWFYYPLTQITTVYTEGVVNIEVKVYIYNRLTESFKLVEMTGEDNEISLRFYNNNNNEVTPYFFFWGGEYTTNDNYQTIYKVEVTYGNESEVYPSELAFFGNLYCNSICKGNTEGEEYPVRFMKLSCYLPENETEAEFLDTEKYYILLGETEDEESNENSENSGYRFSFGTVTNNSQELMENKEYTKTFYLLLETDLKAINEDAYKIANEFGLLEAYYNIRLKFYCHTVPANVPTSTDE